MEMGNGLGQVPVKAIVAMTKEMAVDFKRFHFMHTESKKLTAMKPSKMQNVTCIGKMTGQSMSTFVWGLCGTPQDLCQFSNSGY